MQVRFRRSIALLFVITIASVSWASLAGPAFAAGKKATPKALAKLAFSPREPFDNQPITVTWKADHGPRHLYELYFSISTGDHQTCGSDGYVKPKRTWKKGSTVRVTFTPRDEKVWCVGGATVLLLENGKILATGKVPVQDNSSTPQPDPPGPTQRLTIREGSTMTVTAPGHVDRTSPVTGSMTGRPGVFPIISGPGRPADPVHIYLRSGSLTVAGLPADPLCTPAAVTYPQTLGLNFTHSSVMWHNDFVYATAVTTDDPLALTGCTGPPASAVGRPILLVGQPVNQARVLDGPPIPMHGSLTGIRLSDGTDATIRFDLSARLESLQPGQE